MKQKQLVLDHMEAAGSGSGSTPTFFINIEHDDKFEQVQQSIMSVMEVISNLVTSWRNLLSPDELGRVVSMLLGILVSSSSTQVPASCFLMTCALL